MPKLNIYDQQVSPRANPSSPADFGAGVSEATKQIGSQLSDIAQRSRQRSETIDRVRLQNQFDQQAIALREEFITGEDISDPQAIDRYRQQINQLRENVTGDHSGSASSRGLLKTTLLNQEGQYVKMLMGDQIKAQQAMILGTVEQTVNSLTSVAMTSPDTMDDALVEFEAQINELAPALTEEQEQKYRQAGREQIMSSTVMAYLQKGDYQTAKMLMADDRFKQTLSPDTSRKLRIDTAVQESKVLEKEQAVKDRIASYTMTIGRNLTPEEVERVKLLPDKPGDMTPADKIAEYEVITGKPASQQIVDKFMGTEESGYGTSLRGRALKTINNNTMAYSKGLLSEQDAMEYQSAIYEAYGPKSYTDPVNGMSRTVQPSMPPAVKEALDQGSGVYGPISMGGESGGTSVDPDSAAGGAEVPEGESLWELGSFLTGPGAAVSRVLMKAPFTEGLDVDPRFQRAAMTALQMQNDIVDGIRPEGRIAEQYRQDLKDTVQIEPALWDNEVALRQRLITIDDNLKGKYSKLMNVIENPQNSSVAERQDALQLMKNIEYARNRLNVPPRVKSAKEALDSYPPGTVVIMPDGTARKVPEQR
jgi:hypothetical protein